MIDFTLLKEELIRDEGERLRPYKCSAGKYTIGIGHNIDDKGISPRVSDLMYEDDLEEVIQDLDNNFDWWRNMTGNRQRVLINMCFNLGITRLLKFKNTLKAMKAGDYEKACQGMKNSLWYSQVGKRAVRLIAMMRDG